MSITGTHFLCDPLALASIPLVGRRDPQTVKIFVGSRSWIFFSLLSSLHPGYVCYVRDMSATWFSFTPTFSLARKNLFTAPGTVLGFAIFPRLSRISRADCPFGGLYGRSGMLLVTSRSTDGLISGSAIELTILIARCSAHSDGSSRMSRFRLRPT